MTPLGLLQERLAKVREDEDALIATVRHYEIALAGKRDALTLVQDEIAEIIAAMKKLDA